MVSPARDASMVGMPSIEAGVVIAKAATETTFKTGAGNGV